MGPGNNDNDPWGKEHNTGEYQIVWMSLVGYSPQGRTELDMAEATAHTHDMTPGYFHTVCKEEKLEMKKTDGEAWRSQRS